MNNFDWLKEIDHEKYFEGDLKTLLEIVGQEKFFELYKVFLKTSLYFSEKPLLAMKVEYIKKHFGRNDPSERISVPRLARILDVSERFVYKIGRNINGRKKYQR